MGVRNVRRPGQERHQQGCSDGALPHPYLERSAHLENRTSIPRLCLRKARSSAGPARLPHAASECNDERFGAACGGVFCQRRIIGAIRHSAFASSPDWNRLAPRCRGRAGGSDAASVAVSPGRCRSGAMHPARKRPRLGLCRRCLLAVANSGASAGVPLSSAVARRRTHGGEFSASAGGLSRGRMPVDVASGRNAYRSVLGLGAGLHLVLSERASPGGVYRLTANDGPPCALARIADPRSRLYRVANMTIGESDV